MVCNKCSSRRAVVTKVDPTKMSRVCDDCFKKLTTIDPETVEQIDLDEYDEKADYSKLQEGVVRGIVKGTPSKVDKGIFRCTFKPKSLIHFLSGVHSLMCDCFIGSPWNEVTIAS